MELRNPWGKGEWKGKWSDNDKNWNPTLKKQLNQSLSEDGRFFMPFSEFLKYFHDYQVCYYHDENLYSSQRYSSSSDRPTFIEFEVKKQGQYYFSINQNNKRCYRASDSNGYFDFSHSLDYRYTPVTLAVGRKSSTGKGIRYVGMVKRSDKEMWFKAVCPPGSYFAYVRSALWI